VMVVGDSVALTMGRGLERWGPAHGVEVLNLGRPFCPIARGGRLAASFGNAVDACANWPLYWPTQESSFHPDVVVVLTTVWDVSSRQRDEWGPDFIGPGDHRFDHYVREEWKLATHTLESSGARVVWLTIPCVPAAKGSADIRYVNRHYLGAVRDAGASVVDLSAHVCPRGQFTDTMQGVTGVRPDGLHFSDPGADLVAGWLGPILTAPPAAVPAAPAAGGTLRSELAAAVHR
jgi:hypothetical protein